MSDIAEQVGQRLTERGEWAPGMLTMDGDRIIQSFGSLPDATGPFARYTSHIEMPAGPGEEADTDRDWLHDAAPDLTDWPTIGVLIGAMREAIVDFELRFALDGFNAEAHGWPNGILDAHEAPTDGEAIGALYLATCPAPEAPC